MKKRVRELEVLTSECSSVQDERATLLKQHERRAAELAAKQRALQEAEQRLSQLPRNDELEARVVAARDAAGDAQAQIDAHQSAKSEAQRAERTARAALTSVEQRLAQMNSARERALSAMTGANRPLAEAARWLDANRALFQRAVYGPITLEVRIASERHARVFEAAISWRFRSGFLVQCDADQKRLSEEFQRNKWTFGVLRVRDGPANDAERRRPVDESTARRIGVEHWLDEVVACDDAVMECLRVNQNISSVALCRDDANAEALQDAGIKMFFIKDEKFAITKSNYGTMERSARIDRLDTRPTLVKPTSDRGELAQLEADKASAGVDIARAVAAAKAAEVAEHAARRLVSAVRDAEHALAGANAQRARAIAAVKRAQSDYDELRAEPILSTDDERARLDQRLASIVARRRRLAKFIVDNAIAPLAEARRKLAIGQIKREV